MPTVLFGTWTCNSHKIQRVQSTLAKIVLNDTVLPSVIALRQLHWLPVKQRIHYKMATLTYCTIQSKSPSYLDNPPDFFTLPHSIFYIRYFYWQGHWFAAPVVFNSIPQNIRLLPYVGCFKHSLKTHPFPFQTSQVSHLVKPAPLNLCAL